MLLSSPPRLCQCRPAAALRRATALLLPPRRLQSFSLARRRLPPPHALCWATAVGTRMISSSSSSCFFGYRRTGRRNDIYASLFGVGAPEALVIGVVALLVFGPKGLAEIARNLGKTLRAFQPTIRELQDVSREFRSTLEREIGLDEDPPSKNYKPTTTNSNQQPTVDTNDKPVTAPYTSDELMKVTEEQLAASAAPAWNVQQQQATSTSEAATSAESISEPAPASEAATTPETESNETALPGANDSPGAAASEPNPSYSEKAGTER